MDPNTAFTIKAASISDVPTLAKIFSDSFLDDRHTQMKSQGKDPYDLEQSMAADLPRQIASPTSILLKAVDESTGEIVGWISWGFRGFSHTEIAGLDPDVAGLISNEPGSQKPAEKEKRIEASQERQPKFEPDLVDESPIKQLERITDADLRRWMDKVMPDGTRCMFVISLCVSPKWQGKGVGASLLHWGTQTADAVGAFIWVHSSEGAWRMYQKHGFEILETLDVDLDRYAPSPLLNNRGGIEKWGHYVFRYMKRLPQG
ncbi:hypothetical protein N7474_009306 [Penicillium riverlandense]|uniref:uncharacterized protein n=1 Tax=Penicillium riverlandense TaxID=1903569 RepID=UPI00254758F9|nr:uncharacterized protein N7474_009306 [Penicillium riverlandense]KAJ5808037.1 hypothetical protein N7474_009306 [Penicillium riverlandense]